MNRRSNRRHLNFDCRLAKLLDSSCTHGAAIAHKGSGLAVPLWVNPIDCIFQDRGGTVVVFRRDKYKTIRCRDLDGPHFAYVVFVRRPARHGWWQGLVEEGHWEVAEVEQPCCDRLSLLKLLVNPLSRLFREPILACAANDYGDRYHIFCSLIMDSLVVPRAADKSPTREL